MSKVKPVSGGVEVSTVKDAAQASRRAKAVKIVGVKGIVIPIPRNTRSPAPAAAALFTIVTAAAPLMTVAAAAVFLILSAAAALPTAAAVVPAI